MGPTDNHGGGRQLTSTAHHMAYAAIAVANAVIRKNTTVIMQPLLTVPTQTVTKTSTRLDGGLDQTVSYTRTRMLTRNDGVGGC